MSIDCTLTTRASNQLQPTSCYILQDFLTTGFLVTSKDVFYSRSAFCQLVSYFGDACEAIDLPTPAVLKPLELWTGKQLFTMLVRPNAATRSAACCLVNSLL